MENSWTRFGYYCHHCWNIFYASDEIYVMDTNGNKKMKCPHCNYCDSGFEDFKETVPIEDPRYPSIEAPFERVETVG